VVGDSLVVNGVIELLGGGVPSTQPSCAGAIFRLGKDFDLSAPQMTSEKVSGLLLAGEQITQLRAGNRAPRIPVVINVPSTGDLVADRLTLSAARELLLQTTAQERWSLVWTRDGGLPLVFDCQGLASITVEHSLIYHRSLVSLVEIDFEALPYGRSDDAELLVFPAPSQIWDQPPASVTIDGMTVATSFLTGDVSTYEGGIGTTLAAGNCSVARSTAQFHGGAASLAVTATAAATMQYRHCNPATFDASGIMTGGLAVLPGDTVAVSAFSRAATTARSVNVGVDFWDAAGTQVGSTLRGSNVTNSNANFTTNPTCSVTAPQGAVWAVASLQVVSPANGEVHYFDDLTMNRGAVYSADDPATWALSTITAVSGQNSARWLRVLGDSPVYDHTLASAVDITGRTKLTFWLGLATSSTGYAHWHKGTASFAITLYDAQGDPCSFGIKQVKVAASALLAKPYWQLITAHIPQSIPNFDYTTVSRYKIQVWNQWDPTVPQATLEASAYLCSVTASATATGSPVTRGSWYTLPGIIGTARAPLAVQLQPGLSSYSTVVEFTTAGSNNWTSPVGVTKLDKVEAWGAGGGGAGRTGSGAWGGGGGGGGAYTMKRNVTITASTLYHPIVGTGGTGGAVGTMGLGGSPSYFVADAGVTTRASAGNGGWQGSTSGGGKGGPEASDADLAYAGGNGFQSNYLQHNYGGGGGSSAGTGAAGASATSRYGATPPTGGGPGGYGGWSGGGPGAGSVPTTGPGGGGGGGADQNGGFAGANGANGKIRLTYGATGILPLASVLVHMPGRDATPRLSPLCAVGTGGDTPNGATDYTVPAVANLAARFDGSYTVYLIANTWNTGANSRTVTVTVKQFAYSGGPSVTQALARTLIPNNDVVNGYVEMGVISLPLAEIAPGNTDSYFAVSVNDTNTSDRFYDVLFLDTQGQTVLLNSTGTAFANNVWLDVADLDRDQGGFFASDTDRDRARSWLVNCDPASTRISGGPLSVMPNANNRVLVYAQQGNPGASMTYYPHWWEDRLQ